MSLKEINWKVRYRSARDDLLEDFYIPALKRAVLYKRAAGYFSTSSIALAARGIVTLLKNNGKMQLVVSPNFSKVWLSKVLPPLVAKTFLSSTMKSIVRSLLFSLLHENRFRNRPGYLLRLQDLRTDESCHR